jgi:hypothetical protein
VLPIGRQKKESWEVWAPVSQKRIHERSFQPSNVRIDKRYRRPGWLGGDEQPGMQSRGNSKQALREPTRVRQPDSAPRFLEGRCQPALSKRTAVLLSLTRVPQGEPGNATEHYGDASMMSANRIAFLPYREPLLISSSPRAQINSVVSLLEKRALRGNPKILGSLSDLQP